MLGLFRLVAAVVAVVRRLFRRVLLCAVAAAFLGLFGRRRRRQRRRRLAALALGRLLVVAVARDVPEGREGLLDGGRVAQPDALLDVVDARELDVALSTRV